MKLFLCLLLVLGAAIAIAFTMQTARAASSGASATGSLPAVSFLRGSDDSREVFSFRMQAPWPGAPHRAIAVHAAGVENDGFVSMSYVYANDGDTEVGEEFTAAGPRNRMVVRRNVASWAEVLEASQLTVRVEPNP